MTEVGVVAGVAAVSGPAMHLASAERNAEFAALYASLFREISGYCAALLRDDANAGDVAQEAFIRLFSRWRAVQNPRGFLFLVATNLVRDEYRRRGRQRALVAALEPFTRESVPARDDHALRDVVLRLPRGLRDVVVLHVVADLPVAEVARVTGLPVGTVKRRLHDARKRVHIDWTEER
jgi:RNA polymerase sigma-70 factor (ECF subfamily)